jgi:hypothetical protein
MVVLIVGDNSTLHSGENQGSNQRENQGSNQGSIHGNQDVMRSWLVVYIES